VASAAGTERPPAVCRENAYSTPRGSRRSVTSFRVAAVSIVFEFSETTRRGAVRAGTKRLGPPRLMRRSAGEPGIPGVTGETRRVRHDARARPDPRNPRATPEEFVERREGEGGRERIASHGV